MFGSGCQCPLGQLECGKTRVVRSMVQIVQTWFGQPSRSHNPPSRGVYFLLLLVSISISPIPTPAPFSLASPSAPANMPSSASTLIPRCPINKLLPRTSPRTVDTSSWSGLPAAARRQRHDYACVWNDRVSPSLPWCGRRTRSGSPKTIIVRSYSFSTPHTIHFYTSNALKYPIPYFGRKIFGKQNSRIIICTQHVLLVLVSQIFVNRRPTNDQRPQKALGTCFPPEHGCATPPSFASSCNSSPEPEPTCPSHSVPTPILLDDPHAKAPLQPHNHLCMREVLLCTA